MIKCFNWNTLDLDSEDPFGEILACTGWTMCSTYYTILKATAGQLVFGRDITFDINFTTD